MTLNSDTRCESGLRQGQTVTSIRLQDTVGNFASVIVQSVLLDSGMVYALAILVAAQKTDGFGTGG